MKIVTAFLIITSYLTLIGCTNRNSFRSQCDFVINVCDITYKGEKVPFGESINAWEKLFGKYSRRIGWHGYVWDSLGIYLRKSDYSGMDGVKRKEDPDCLHIMFVNLESQIGQAGELEWASDYESFEHILKRNAEGGYIYSQTEKQHLKKIVDEDSVTRYPYPFKLYFDTVLLDGGIIAKGMTLKEVNKYRTVAGNKGEFGYWDTDMDWKNERASTSVKTGQFNDFDMEREKQKCALESSFYYLSTLRYTQGVLEYIKIEKVEKGKSVHWR